MSLYSISAAGAHGTRGSSTGNSGCNSARAGSGIVDVLVMSSWWSLVVNPTYTGPGKILATNCANMYHFALVPFLMHVQLSLLTESHIALITSEESWHCRGIEMVN